jgi:hypothetical protein
MILLLRRIRAVEPQIEMQISTGVSSIVGQPGPSKITAPHAPPAAFRGKIQSIVTALYTIPLLMLVSIFSGQDGQDLLRKMMTVRGLIELESIIAPWILDGVTTGAQTRRAPPNQPTDRRMPSSLVVRRLVHPVARKSSYTDRSRVHSPSSTDSRLPTAAEGAGASLSALILRTPSR